VQKGRGWGDEIVYLREAAKRDCCFTLLLDGKKKRWKRLDKAERKKKTREAEGSPGGECPTGLSRNQVRPGRPRPTSIIRMQGDQEKKRGGKKGRNSRGIKTAHVETPVFVSGRKTREKMVARIS